MQTTPTWPPAERHHDETAGHHKVKPTTTKAKPAKVLYPDPDKHPKSLRWLAYFFRDCAELKALEDLVKEQHRLKRPPPDYVFHALYGAICQAESQIKTWPLKYLVEEGQLLFAHQDTTIFNQVVA